MSNYLIHYGTKNSGRWKKGSTGNTIKSRESLSNSKNSDKKVNEISNEEYKKFESIAQDVIRGKYGNGEDRKKAMKKAGYSYDTIQNIVNNKLIGTKLNFSVKGQNNKSTNIKSTNRSRKYKSYRLKIKNKKQKNSKNITHLDSSDYIAHIGNKNSGRYRRGSGQRPHQHDGLMSRFKRQETNQKNPNKSQENYKKDEKSVSKMSDQQLDHHVNRLRKQKEAKELSHFLVDKHAFDKPKPDSIFVKAGRRIGETALTGAGLYALKSVISKEFDRKELGDAVFRGGAKKK